MRASDIDATIVARLATCAQGSDQPFLQPHHVIVAERLERLIRRAQIMQRVTMSYDAARTGANGNGGNAVEAASDSAADARTRLNRLAAGMPGDCWGVLFDVCGLGKGLQMIECERGWPRRSAKLVLRIGLDHLAASLGILPAAQGRASGQERNWLEQRLPLIARP